MNCGDTNKGVLQFLGAFVFNYQFPLFHVSRESDKISEFETDLERNTGAHAAGIKDIQFTY